MVVLITCNNEEDPNKNEGVNIINQFFRRTRAVNFVSSGRICPKFKLIQAFMPVHVTCKNKEDEIKNEGTRVAPTFLPF